MNRLRSRLFVASAIVFSILTSAQAFAAEVVPIKLFQEVSPSLYRGARPGHAGMAALAQLGIKTDIDLENDGAAVAAEVEDAKSLGIRIVSRPMSGFFAPSDETVNEVLALMEDPANLPVFVHCKHGQDRTGLVVGLYRVLYEGWSKHEAYREMREIGFHPYLLGLLYYFDVRSR